MTINVSAAINSDTAIKITVERRVGGGYVDGNFVPGVITTFTTRCSPQQPNTKDLEFLPEGSRDKDIFKFISIKPIRTVSDRDVLEPDVVIYKGLRYKIVVASDWDLFGHTTCLGVRIK